MKTEDLQFELDNLRLNTIGLLVTGNVIELIVTVHNDPLGKRVDTIRVSQFGALQQSFNIPLDNYRHILFTEEAPNLLDVLKDPFKFQALCKDLGLE